MNDKSNPPDIATWLSDQPLNPSKDFVEKTIARLHTAPDAADEVGDLSGLDLWLADQPITPSSDFTQQILTEISTTQAAKDLKIIGMPNWVFALSTMAATLVIMMAAFTWMYRQGLQAPRPASIAHSSNDGVAPPLAKHLEPIPLATNDLPTTAFATLAISDIVDGELEDILVMDEALQALSNLNDEVDVWATLALLVDD